MDPAALDPGEFGRPSILKSVYCSIAPRTPVSPDATQVMVKITGGAHGMKAIAAHFRYIGRQGKEKVGGKGKTLEGARPATGTRCSSSSVLPSRSSSRCRCGRSRDCCPHAGDRRPLRLLPLRVTLP